MAPEVYWITDIQPLRLAVMPRPRGGEWLPDEVAGWKQAGIGSVVSLLHRYEAEELEIVEEEALCLLHGIRYRSFPIQDRGVPESAPLFLRLAEEVASSVQAGEAVAIHCRAGIGRSGLLAAVVLSRLGVSDAEAFAVVSRARGLQVPDTPAQVQWFASVGRRGIAL